MPDGGESAEEGQPTPHDAGPLGADERAELERLRAENARLRSHPSPPGASAGGQADGPAPPAGLARPGRDPADRAGLCPRAALRARGLDRQPGVRHQPLRAERGPAHPRARRPGRADRQDHERDQRPDPRAGPHQPGRRDAEEQGPAPGRHAAADVLRLARGRGGRLHPHPGREDRGESAGGHLVGAGEPDRPRRAGQGPVRTRQRGHHDQQRPGRAEPRAVHRRRQEGPGRAGIHAGQQHSGGQPDVRPVLRQGTRQGPERLPGPQRPEDRPAHPDPGAAGRRDLHRAQSPPGADRRRARPGRVHGAARRGAGHRPQHLPEQRAEQRAARATRPRSCTTR